MTISALPTPPARSMAPAVFIPTADAFLAALPIFVSQTNATGAQATADGQTATAQAVLATTQANNAATQAINSANSAAAAAASAASAVAGVATAATSTTSLTIGNGSQTLTVQTGKNFVVGMFVQIAYTTTPSTWMNGVITAYNSGTGVLNVTTNTFNGSGTQTAWTISISAPNPTPLSSINDPVYWMGY
jgi:hypothetical protein